jgi:uncharacterized protein with HEPN domain
MQPEERDAAYLWDMLQAAEEVRDMVGEAARRVSAAFMDAHPEVPWRLIIGQRNILAHGYGHIDHELLFRTVIDDLPGLIGQLQALLPPLEGP